MRDTGIDFIGDVHGHYAQLRALLQRLGYARQSESFRPPSGRHAVFVGDIIDRGPEIAPSLRLVRTMVDAGHATLLMGNHELNALGFHHLEQVSASPYHPGQSRPPHALRPRSLSRIRQHQETLTQFADAQGDLASHLRWFRQLPFAWEANGVRAVHAAWIPWAIAVLSRLSSPLSDADLAALFARGSEVARAADLAIKGPEMDLPSGESFVDSDGTRRTRSRVAWWLDGRGRQLRDYLFPFGVSDSPLRLPQALHPDLHGYTDPQPVLVGHYWLDGPARVQSPRLAILDYSVARGGCIMAYRWDGEELLDASRMVSSSGDLDAGSPRK